MEQFPGAVLIGTTCTTDAMVTIGALLSHSLRFDLIAVRAGVGLIPSPSGLDQDLSHTTAFMSKVLRQPLADRVIGYSYRDAMVSAMTHSGAEALTINELEELLRELLAAACTPPAAADSGQ